MALKYIPNTLNIFHIHCNIPRQATIISHLNYGTNLLSSLPTVRILSNSWSTLKPSWQFWNTNLTMSLPCWKHINAYPFFLESSTLWFFLLSYVSSNATLPTLFSQLLNRHNDFGISLNVPCTFLLLDLHACCFLFLECLPSVLYRNWSNLDSSLIITIGRVPVMVQRK